MQILRENPDMQAYILNTGSIGAKAGSAGEKITIKISTEIMKQIAKEGIRWEKDPDWGYEIPARRPGRRPREVRPAAPLLEAEEYAALVDKLRAERREWLAKFPGLDAVIPKAIEKRAVGVRSGRRSRRHPEGRRPKGIPDSQRTESNSGIVTAGRRPPPSALPTAAGPPSVAGSALRASGDRAGHRLARSLSQVGFLHLRIRRHLGGGPLQRDLARLEHVGAVGVAQRGVGVLLDEQDRRALPR